MNPAETPGPPGRSEQQAAIIQTVLLRVWVPDRPGALGAVASRVGAVGGDVVGIDILERGAGRAIDELWVELSSTEQLPLLIAEVSEVDGVDVEDCRPVDIARRSAALHAFNGALELLELGSTADVLGAMADLVVDACSAEGAVVVPTGVNTETEAGAEHGPVFVAGFSAEDANWLVAFARGVATTAETDEFDASDFPDLAVGVLPRAGSLLAVSRRGLTFRAKERQIIRDVAAAADHRLAELN